MHKVKGTGSIAYVQTTVPSSCNFTNPRVGHESDSRGTREGHAGDARGTCGRQACSAKLALKKGREGAAFSSVLATCTLIKYLPICQSAIVLSLEQLVVSRLTITRLITRRICPHAEYVHTRGPRGGHAWYARGRHVVRARDTRQLESWHWTVL